MITFDNLIKKTSLSGQPGWEAAARILAASLSAVDPAVAVAACVRRSGDVLQVAGEIYDLKDYDQVLAVGAGKAGRLMGQILAGILGDRLTAGVIITKHPAPVASGLETGPVLYLTGGHPVPDQRSLESTQRLLACLKCANERTLVFALISGGGSALMTAPVPGVSLADLQRLTGNLLACGATIHEINTLRKHLDWVKGGRLAQMVFPARLVSLILSDVVGNPLDVICSGPTVADPSTYQDALDVLERYRVRQTTPPGILTVLEEGRQGKLPETMKTGDPRLDGVQNEVIASNWHAARAACQQAEVEGFASLLLTTYLQGEASQAGSFLAEILRELAASTAYPLKRPACIVVGGETTVVLKGDGLGGRNLEVALGAVKGLVGLENVALLTMATDGEDGPAPAAGAVVTGATSLRAAAAGLSPVEYLDRNDSYHFFEGLGDLIVTGSTGTNVNDLAFLFAF